jgi:hypothetical protein
VDVLASHVPVPPLQYNGRALKLIPVLFPPSVDRDAYHVVEDGDALQLLIDMKLIWNAVAALAVKLNVPNPPDTPRVTTLPDVPVTDHVVIVVVVLGSNSIVCATVFVLANVVKVFDPVKVVVEMPVVPPIEMPLYDRPPPANVLAEVVVLDNARAAVPLVKVRLVVVEVSHTVSTPVNVHVPEPICRVLVIVLLESNLSTVTE